MAKCTNCGSELTGSFCTNCGTPAPAPAPAPAPQQFVNPAPAPQQNYSNPAPAPTPVYNNISVAQQENVTGVGGWIGWMFLMSFLPIIGQIIMLACSNDKSVKNFAKAQFVLMGIGAAIFIILFLIFVVLVGVGSASIN